MDNYLTRESILNAKPKTKKLFIDELDGYCFIRKISGRDRDSYINILKQAGAENEAENSLEMAVALGLSDENGKRIFTDEDVNKLSDLPLAVLHTLAAEIFKYNGMQKDAVEEAVKN